MSFEFEKHTEKPLISAKTKIKYENIVTKKVRDLKNLIKLNELKENEQIRIITEKSYNAITFIEFIIGNEEIEEIYIAVYRMNLPAVQKIINWANEGIKMTILLSNFFRENKRYERWAETLANNAAQNKNINVFFYPSHAKVFLAKTKSGKHFVFEGSGNLSDNARIEQYIFENNEKTYKFHKSWLESLQKTG
jgi:hypothetical protein